MVGPVFLRRVGAVVGLVGIGCLLVGLVLPWVHFEPDLALPWMAGVSPEDYSLLRLLRIDRPLFHPVPAALIFYLRPLLGSCCVVVEALRAWQGRAATLLGSALLLLSMGCAL